MMLIVRPCAQGCGNFTIPRKRTGQPARILSEAEQAEVKRYNAHQESTKDGTCLACWNHAHGRGRTMSNPQSAKVGRMTEHDKNAAQVWLKNYWMDRRKRGVDPEGEDPAGLGNGGLYCVDVT